MVRMFTFRTIFADRRVLFRTTSLITSVTGNKSIPARAEVFMSRTGVLAHTGRDWLGALRDAVVSFAYEIEVAINGITMSALGRTNEM